MISVSFLNLFSRIITFSLSLSLSLRYKTFLSEDAGPDTLVAIVHANDPDGDAVSYAVTGGNEDSNFLLDKQKGEEKLWRLGAKNVQHQLNFFHLQKQNCTTMSRHSLFCSFGFEK